MRFQFIPLVQLAMVVVVVQVVMAVVVAMVVVVETLVMDHRLETRIAMEAPVFIVALF